MVRFPPRFCSLLQQITAVAPAVLEETHQPDLPEQLNCYFLTVGSSLFQPAFPHYTVPLVPLGVCRRFQQNYSMHQL